MDYKEKYEQALSRARQFSEKPLLEDSAGIVEYIFPELAKSEDESIRKKLISYFSSVKGFSTLEYNYGISNEDAVAWLEKQGEQNHAEWSEEDGHRIKDIIYFLDTAKKHYASTVELDACINWLKSLRPQVHWKPTKEQMDALWRRIAEIKISDERPSDIYILGELYEQLENL